MLPDGNPKSVAKIEDNAKKKTTHYKEQSAEKVAEYEEKMREIPEDKRGYVDEAGFDSYYGSWSDFKNIKTKSEFDLKLEKNIVKEH